MTRRKDNRNWPFTLLLGCLMLIALPQHLSAKEATIEEAKSIARLYSAAFDREPKTSGLNFWIDALEDGNSMTAIANKFNQSPEFKTKYGALSNRQFIEQLFRNVLGRDGAKAGIDFWDDKLANGASRALVLTKFADSPENIAKTLETFANMHVKNGEWSYQGNYNIAYWRRLLQEINSRAFKSDSLIYSRLPNVQSCDPGALSEAAKARSMEVLNQVRSLHGLTPVQYDPIYDPEIQSTALVQRANSYINHFPATTDKCHTGLGASGASSSNLRLVNPAQNMDPASDIIGWIVDRNSVNQLMAALHRRWSLYPELGYISYGQVFGASVQKHSNFGDQPRDTRPPGLEFVAYPYETYPYILVENTARPTPWSLSIVPPNNSNSPANYFGKAEVLVTDSATGRQLNVHSLYSDSLGAGLRNFLSWLVDDYEYDTRYLVEIKNIQMAGGEMRNLEYYVKLDYANIAPGSGSSP